MASYLWKATYAEGQEPVHRIEALDAVTAQPRFEGAFRGLSAYEHNSLVQSVVLLTKSYSCLCSAKPHETTRARELWKQVKRYLKAGREDMLLSRIGEALSRPV